MHRIYFRLRVGNYHALTHIPEYSNKSKFDYKILMCWERENISGRPLENFPFDSLIIAKLNNTQQEEISLMWR